MKSLKNLTGDSLEQLIDYNVVDQNGDEIGTLHSLWSDPDTGSVEFLGVKTGWLFGQNHVVPAGKAELDEETNVVRLPYTEAFIKEAPAISADAEISEDEENNIYQYYGMSRAEAGTTGTTAGDPSATGGSTGSSFGGVTLPEPAGAAPLVDASGRDEALGAATVPVAGMMSHEESGAAGSSNRWRRTSRPSDAGTSARGTMDSGSGGGTTFGDSTTVPTAGQAVRAALDDLAPADASGTRTPLTPMAPGSYGTANLYGSTGTSTPVSMDALGAATGGTSTTGAAHGGTSTTDPDGLTRADTSGTAGDLREAGSKNLDPITGEPGAHPVGTGVGAFSGGAAGAALGGVVGGPIGAPVGAVVGGIIGAIGGGLTGKGVAESIHPTEEDAYWQGNYKGTSYFQNDYEYSDYAPAYKTGYEGYSRHAGSGREYGDVESDLKQDYEQNKGDSRLEWEKAKAATRDAWERLKAKTSNAAK